MKELFELQVLGGLLGEFFFDFGEFDVKPIDCLFRKVHLVLKIIGYGCFLLRLKSVIRFDMLPFQISHLLLKLLYIRLFSPYFVRQLYSSCLQLSFLLFYHTALGFQSFGILLHSIQPFLKLLVESGKLIAVFVD